MHERTHFRIVAFSSASFGMSLLTSFFISFQTTRGEPLSIVLENETHKSMVAWIRKQGQEDDSAKFFVKVRWEHVLKCLTGIVGKKLVDKASGGHGKTLGSKCMRQFAATILLQKHEEPNQAMRRIGGSSLMARRHYADRGSQAFQKLQEKRLIIGSSSSSSSSSESPEETETETSAPSTPSSDGDKRRKKGNAKGESNRCLEESESSDSSDDTEKQKKRRTKSSKRKRDSTDDGERCKKSKKGKLLKGQTAKSSKLKGKSSNTIPSSDSSSNTDSDANKATSNTIRSSDTSSDTSSNTDSDASKAATSSESASAPPVVESVAPAKVVTPGRPSSAVPDTGGGTSQPTEAEAEACEALAEDIDVAAGGTTPPSDE